MQTHSCQAQGVASLHLESEWRTREGGVNMEVKVQRVPMLFSELGVLLGATI